MSKLQCSDNILDTNFTVTLEIIIIFDSLFNDTHALYICKNGVWEADGK